MYNDLSTSLNSGQLLRNFFIIAQGAIFHNMPSSVQWFTGLALGNSIPPSLLDRESIGFVI
jgi:hypothetical protein